MPLAASTRLGRYEIVDLLGAGGMGEVYRARDPQLGRDVAVKVIQTEGTPSPERLRRFEVEARAVARLSHPNVLTVFDVGTCDGMAFVVFELLDGKTLRQALAHGPLPARRAVDVALQVCQGLQAAHARDIVHRDLKPENLLLTSDGRVKILDFGLAKLTRGDGAARPSDLHTETLDGVILGTLGYLSPEQARGRDADARSDLFALGAILYEALSGQPAFSGATRNEMLSAILHTDPPAITLAPDPIAAPVERIVRRCLEKEPERRFHSAHDLALAFEAVLERPGATLVAAEDREVLRPYPGLGSFKEADAARFFGRETELPALWEKIQRCWLLAVIGPSGAGKTSFIRAGVVAARPSGWRAIVTTPGTTPFLMLAQALASEMSADVAASRELLRFEDADAALSSLSRWRQAHAGALLVVDQFEELFTLNPPEVQSGFAALLGRLSSEADIHVLLSMRDDFLMRCHKHEALAPVFAELTPLGPLSEDGKRRALVEPARAEGYRFEDEGLVEKMLAAVAGERGALPLLAFAVSRLWDMRDRDGRRLTRAAYAEIGGVSGALAQHAEATLERIGAEHQRMVREVFRNLVTAHGTRATADREELLSVFDNRGTAEGVLRQLIDARLLTSYEMPGDEGQPSHHRIEIVHESLLQAWPRLVRWEAQDAEGALLRDQLKQAAHLWEEKGRPADLLWTGTSFREYELWRERYPGTLTTLEEQFTRAMVERGRRRQRIWRAVAATVVASLSVVAIVVSWSRYQAVNARDQARMESRRAEASKLVTLGQLRLKDDPTEALAFTTASLELADSEEARVFATRVLWEAPPTFDLEHDGLYLRVPAFSPDGKNLAVVGHGVEGRIWSEDGRLVLRLPGHETSPKGPNDARWASNEVLVTGLGGLANYVQVWSLSKGTQSRKIEFGSPSSWQTGPDRLFVETVEKDASGRSQSHLLTTWRLPEGPPETLGRIDGTTIGGSHVTAFEPSGRVWLYAKGHDVFARPLPASSKTPDALFIQHEADLRAMGGFPGQRDRFWSLDVAGGIRVWALSEQGPSLLRAVAGPRRARDWAPIDNSGRWILNDWYRDGLALLWDMGMPAQARPFTLRRSGSWYGAFTELHPRGDWLVATPGYRLTFWPLRQPSATVVPGYSSMSRPMAFSPDGRWLATTWSDGRLRLWPVPGSGVREPKIFELPENTLWGSLEFDPHGRYLFAVGNSDGAWIVPLDGSPPRRLPVYSEETFLYAGAVSPSGRLVATAWGYGGGAKTLRMYDVERSETRVFPLPESPAPKPGASPPATVLAQTVFNLAFTDESTLYSAGEGGLRRWNLRTGTQELVASAAFFHFWGRPTADAGTVLTLSCETFELCVSLRLLDLNTGQSRAVPGFEAPGRGDIGGDLTGTVMATGDDLGIVRVGRVSGGPVHWLVGHEGPAGGIAISPDLRWVASTGQDSTLRLWPMPDLSKPPLHALPREALIAKLKSFTNLRAVPSADSPGHYRIEIGPFPGWKDVPTW